MAGLITDLLQSSQALDAQQMGLQVTSNNLANVNNSSYARETLQLGTPGVMETSIGEVSMGLEATGIQQVRNPFLDAQVTSEISQTGILTAEQTQLQQAQANLGEQVSNTDATSSIDSSTESTTGISSALSNFFNAASDLASNPSDTSAKQVLVQSASTLANTVNSADANLASLQSGISTQINQDVGTVNGLLQNIASLNGQIQNFSVQNPNSTANDLIDQRQADLEQLAGYMNFTATPIPNGNGQIQVTTLDSHSNPVTLVDQTSVINGGISFTGTAIAAGSNNPPDILGLTGGSLQGDINASTGAIQTLRNNLATTASQLTTAVNAAYSTSGNNFFQASPSAGQLLTVDPSLTVSSLKTTATANSGANELALAISNVGTQSFSTGNGDQINGTLTDYYSSAVTGIGESIDGVTSQLTDQTTVQQMVTQQRNSVSGVNEDEELTNLMAYQSAFQAQSRVMNTVNDCLDIVCNGLFGASVS